MPGQLNPAFLISTIQPILELLAQLEKRQFFRSDFNLLPGFGISTSVSTLFFNEKGTKAPDFNSIPLCQRVGHFIEKQVYDRFSFRF
jgi:hypothetical protein